jgi:hypothetical protein
VGTRGKGSNGHFSEFRPAVIGRGLGTRQPEVVSHIFYQSFWAINRYLQSDFIGFWPLLCGNVYGFTVSCLTCGSLTFCQIDPDPVSKKSSIIIN